MKRAVPIILVTLVILRIAILWAGAVRGVVFSEDPDAYRAIAENFLDTGTFGNGEIPTAYRPPLYPMLLVPAVQMGRWCQSEMVFRLSVAMLHSLLIALTLMATWLLARRLFAQRFYPTQISNVAASQSGYISQNADHTQKINPRAAYWGSWLAVAGVALDPILVQQSTQLMTETTAVFFAVMLLLLGNPIIASTDSDGWMRISWWRVPITGLFFGFASLCRPAFLPFCGVMALLYLIPILRNPLLRKMLREWNPFGKNSTTTSRSMVRSAQKNAQAAQDAISAMNLLRTTLAWGVFVLCGLSVLLVWGLRNRACFGQSIWTTTHGGYTLLLANNADFYAWLRQGDTSQPWNAKRLQREIGRRNPYTGGIPLGMPDPSGQIRTPENLAIPQPIASQTSPPANFSSTTVPSTTIRVERVTDELALDAQLASWAKQVIRDDPAGFGRAIVWRLSRFFGMKPLGQPDSLGQSETSSLRSMLNWGVAVYYAFEWVLIGLAIVGTFCDWKRCKDQYRREATLLGEDSESAFTIWLSGWILIGVTVSIHTLYWTDMRMRAVLIPVLVLLAVRGVWVLHIFDPNRQTSGLFL